MSAEPAPPLVSVLVPAHNARDFIAAAVASVVDQTLADWECIVVDDGSTDGTIEALSHIDDTRLRIVRQANGGKANALNHGLRLARAAFVCILDADDVCNPGRLEAQSAALVADPQLGASFCRHELVVGEQRICPRFRPADRDEVAAMIERMANPALDPTIMWRRELGMAFAEDLHVGEGSDHLLRIGEQHPMVVVAGCHYGYRMHSGSKSRHDPARTTAFRREVVRRACERRGLPPESVASTPAVQRRTPVANVVGHAVQSTLELRAMGDRRRAVLDTLRFSRLGWRSLRAQLPLCYALAPMWLLRRKRPDVDGLPRAPVRGAEPRALNP